MDLQNSYNIRVRILTSYFRKLPDYIICGVQKGGTSALFNYLNTNNQVSKPKKKELHYFDIFYKRGIQWYQSNFPYKNNKNLTGEATPDYCFHPLACRRISQDIQGVKIIVLFRNPIDRAFSHYSMWKKFKREFAPSFEEVIELEESRLKYEYEKVVNKDYYNSYSLHEYSYVSRGFYYNQAKSITEMFEKSNVLFLKSESFFSDTQSILKTVGDFLGITQEFDQHQRFKPVNNQKYNEQISYATRNKLVELYAPDMKKFYDLTGIYWDEFD